MRQTTGFAAHDWASGRIGRFWLPLLIAVAGIAAYANSFSGIFVYDDFDAIPGNASIRHLSRLGLIFFPPPDITVSGRPFLNLSFAVNYALGGTNVWGYHATNLLIHVIAGLTLFGVIRRTCLRWNPQLPTQLTPLAAGNSVGNTHSPCFGGCGNPRDSTFLAFAIALIWVLHPLQTESVTYIVQRAESLMGLFYLLTLYCFVRSVEADGNARHRSISPSCFEGGPSAAPAGRIAHRSFAVGWALLSFLSCLLGMATKEVMVSAPVIVLLYDRTFVAGSFKEAWRRRRLLHIGMASTWILLGCLLIAEGGGRGGSAGFGTGIAWWVYGLTQFEAVARYIQLAFWPHPLVFEYGTFWVKDAREIIPYAFAVVPLVAAAAVALWRWPAWGFFGFWFFAILAPTTLVPGTTQMIVEHRMYLALAPLLTAILAPLYTFWTRAGMRRGSLSPNKGHSSASAAVGLAILAFVAAVCGRLTAIRNEDYHNAVTLWEDTASKRPQNALAHNNLGTAELDSPGHLDNAIAQFNQALRIKPTYEKAYANRAAAWLLKGDYDRALADADEAIRLKPTDAAAYHNRAVAHMRRGDLERALADCNDALRLKPSYAEAYSARAGMYLRIGDYKRAFTDCNEAIFLKPDYAEAYTNRAAVWLLKGDYDRALADADEAIRLKSTDAEAYTSRAAAHVNRGDLERALADCNDALRLKPSYAEAYAARAGVYLRIGDYERAFADCNEAIFLKPDYAEAYTNRAAVWSKKGDYLSALADCNEALHLNPGYAEAYFQRANAYAGKGDYALALTDYGDAIARKPSFGEALFNRANIYAGKGDYDRALADYGNAIGRDPAFAEAYNNLAWLRAACSEDRIRNGRQAEDYAKKACELAAWKNPDYVDTLAAACAEAGAFDDAVKWERKYLEFGISKEAAESARQRLSLYAMKKAYHEEKKAD